MTTQLQELIDKKANLWSQMTEVMDRSKGGMKPEDEVVYDRIEDDLEKVDRDIARAEAFAAREQEYNRVDRSGVVGPSDEEIQNLGDEPAKGYTKAFDQYMKHGLVGMNYDDQRTLQAGLVKDDAIRNAAGVGTNTAGGFTVPPAFRNRIVERLAFVASMRQWAEVITTDTGATLPWPTVDDTANEGAILGENTQDTEQDVVFGQADIGAYMYTSKIVRASLQLLNDSGFDFDGWLANALAARIGRIQNRHFTVGTGTGQPDGIVTSSLVGKTGAAGQVTTIVYDDLVDMSDSIDLAYAQAGDVGWMMSQTARKVVRKLKDSQNRPLWEPSLQVGVADSLLGYPLKINNYVPVPAASAKSVLFGDIREAYLIRDVSDFALLRLSERYADFLQVGFLGFQRSDGTMKNTNAVRAYQHPAA